MYKKDIHTFSVVSRQEYAKQEYSATFRSKSVAAGCFLANVERLSKNDFAGITRITSICCQMFSAIARAALAKRLSMIWSRWCHAVLLHPQ